MIEPFTVAVCEPSGHAIHPPRPVCPHCGATRFEHARADAGVLEALTERRPIAQPRRLPAGDPIDQRKALIARVRLDAGPIVICRLLPDDGGIAQDPSAPAPMPGARVRLRVSVLEHGSRVTEATVEPARE